jgi:hypothetical protein
MVRRLAGYFVVSAIVCTGLLAQDWATLSVTVVDPSAAVVPGAGLTLLDLLRGSVRSGQTHDAGYFVFDSLPPGDYELSVTKAGFDTIRIGRITLGVRDRQTLRLDLHLSPASGASIQVTDTVEAPSDDVAQGAALDQEFLQNLPTNGRRVEALIAMAPGVTPGRGDGFNVNGLRSNTNYYTLDGVSLNSPVGGGGGPGGGGPGGGGPGRGPGGPGGGGGAMPMGGGGSSEMISIDAMQELRVQTSSFAPEFGRSPGAQVVMTSRGGTNGFHGSLFYYGRSDKFDSNDWFANAGSYPRGKERERRPGGTFGGPILKNKTFFFASFEQLHLLSPTTVVATVPDLASRKSASASLRPFLNAFPIPNGAVLDNDGAEFRAVISNPSDSRSGSLRIDHLLTSRMTLFARYSVTPSTSGGRMSEMLSPNLVSQQASHSHTGTAGLTRTFSGGAVNDLRVNYSRFSSHGNSTMDDFGGAVPLTASQVFPKGISSATGSFSLNIMGFAGYSYGGATANRQEQVNVVDSLTKVVETHHFKTGVDLRRTMATNSRMPYSVSVAFDGITGSDYSFLQKIALNGQVTSSVPEVYPTYTNFSLYAQDTWRASARTTITYGLRWDVNPAPTARRGAKPYALSSSTIAGVTQNEPLYPTRWFDVAPRFGVAYLSDTTAGHELILRSGVGMFYDLGYGVSGGAFNGAPYTSVRTISEAAFPLASIYLAAPVLPPIRPYGQVTAAEAGLKSPRIYQWNGSVEKYFGHSQMLSVGVVGTLGKRLMRTEMQPTYSDAYDLLMLSTNGASSSYNGLQIQFRKRLSASFQTQFSYTWSHAIDSSSSDAGGGGGFASLYGSGDRNSSDFDMRHNLSFSGSLRLPAPQHGFGTSLIRNWYVDFVATAHTSLPFDLQAVTTETSSSSSTSTSSTNKGLFATVRPTWNGRSIWIRDVHVPGGRRVNRDAFFVADGYTQGNLSRNALRGFPLLQADMSMRRMIPIRERVQLNIAAQAYNALNHPNFSNPMSLAGGSLSSPNFGVATRMAGGSFGGGGGALFRSGGARSMELSVRLQF